MQTKLLSISQRVQGHHRAFGLFIMLLGLVLLLCAMCAVFPDVHDEHWIGIFTCDWMCWVLPSYHLRGWLGIRYYQSIRPPIDPLVYSLYGGSDASTYYIHAEKWLVMEQRFVAFKASCPAQRVGWLMLSMESQLLYFLKIVIISFFSPILP